MSASHHIARVLLILVATAGLAGCPPRQGAAPTPGVGGAPGGAPPAPGAFVLPSSEVIVANVGSNAIVGYALANDGLIIDTTTPTRIVGGSVAASTWVGVRNPFGLTLDSGGRIFVSNIGDVGNPPSITAFAGDANGPTPAFDSYSGGTSQLIKPQGIALRRTPRSLMVANWNDPAVPGIQSEVLEFDVPPGSGQPTGRIQRSGAFGGPAGVAVDVTQNVIVLDALLNAIHVYQPRPGTTFIGSPLRTIQGANTALDRPISVAVDDQGTIYVVNLRHNSGDQGFISVFAPGANGDVAPVRILGAPFGGSASSVLRQPFGVAALPSGGRLYVTQGNTLLVFDGAAAGNAQALQTVSHPMLNYTTAVAVRVP
jgi:hypothetical protein